LSALHVSGDVFAHHQEHLTAFTSSGNVTNVAAGWCHSWDGTIFFSFSALHVSGDVSPIIRSTRRHLQHLVMSPTSLPTGVIDGMEQIYFSFSALHVSGDVFAHHQEHLTVFTASGNVHQYGCRLVSWMGWNGVPTHPAGSNIGENYQML